MGWLRACSTADAPTMAIPNPALRSRGLLCLDALRHRTAAEAATFVRSQRGEDYNAFNLLVASREEAFVAYNRGGGLELVNLTPGMHLLTNVDLNDFECPRISRAHDRFASLCPPAEFARDPLHHREQLARLLADQSNAARRARGTAQRALPAHGRLWDALGRA